MITIDTKRVTEGQLKHLLSIYRAKHEEMERIDSIWKHDDSPEVESQWDAAYREEWNAFESLIKSVTGVTGLAPKMARKLVITHEAELFRLLEV